MEITAKQIADHLNGELEGDSSVKVSSVARIESAKPGTLAFYGNPKYEKYFYSTKASVILINKSFKPTSHVTATLIRVDDVYQAIASMLEFFSSLKSSRRKGRSLRASISWRSKVGKGSYVGAGAVIEKGAKIGKGCQIYPLAFVGKNSIIGDNTTLYSGAKIYSDCVIGQNCIIHSNAVIGADGFGFAPLPDGSYKKIQQTGNVIIEDNCEIGANTTIDRASIGSTIIRQGVKLDNLIQVAHNTEIGENTVIAAQAGISGSVKIGKGCMLGGQVGLSGHISIADNTSIGAQAGIMSSIKEEGRSLLGSPAMDAKEYLRAYSIFRKLHKR
ncbi:MAG: UDP-3-O-(3-hydroxymyristoyl)glucosamine N-acyltransferase [Bacteroidales bacterium]|nr:UDP-3-O-(3-hydroxymyristoyl)glucosamine N-acyltransferase [Bacteroidales bacterium]MDD4656044.1 UDP-3-O-(3-hydroxymyristoyl)glucosamine N-acyltransferase [Bacteroidales bacterium]